MPPISRNNFVLSHVPLPFPVQLIPTRPLRYLSPTFGLPVAHAMKTLRSALTSLGLFLICASHLHAALGIGDPAPKLQVAKWVQGDAVTAFSNDKAYIVEFWATWCGPCRTSIPHLNEIHEKFKDKGLIVIGQDVWEQDEAKVAPFLKEMGAKMTYRVALDDKSKSQKGAMADTWMTAAERNGIPSAFLVDKAGKIAWIGHPMQLKEDFIEAVLAGKHDLTKAKADYDAEQKKQAAARESQKKLSDAMGEFRALIDKKEWDKAEAQLAVVQKLADDLPNGSSSSFVQNLRFQLVMGKGDPAAALAIARDAVEKAPEAQKAMTKQIMASRIVGETRAIGKNDLIDQAVAWNEEVAAAQSGQPYVHMNLARAYFLAGQQDKAVATQEKAIGLTKDSRMKDVATATLEAMRKGEFFDAREVASKAAEAKKGTVTPAADTPAEPKK